MTNQIFTKTTTDRYIAVNNETLNKLTELACLKSWHLYFNLAKRQSFKNGLVGIFEELSFYDLMKELNAQLNLDFNTDKIKRLLTKLEKAKLLTVINQRPLILILTSAEQAETLKTLDDVLNYVKHNEAEFNFQVMKKRADEFFSFFKIERVQQTDKADLKAIALDELVRARPSRQAQQPQHAPQSKPQDPERISREQELASAWQTAIDKGDDSYFDPFKNFHN
jgi:hypothetical protein